jgi:hypothetical protein
MRNMEKRRSQKTSYLYWEFKCSLRQAKKSIHINPIKED